MSFEAAASALARPYGADNGARFTVWTGSARMLGQSLPVHGARPRSAASTAERPDGAGDDDQGGEERGGCL
jgi:hypothetical protein